MSSAVIIGGEVGSSGLQKVSRIAAGVKPLPLDASARPAVGPRVLPLRHDGLAVKLSGASPGDQAMLIPAETAGLFFAAAIALALSPGPDNIFVLTQSALHGRTAGVLVTLGLCTGLIAHTAAVALGVAAVFAASAVAFTTLKLLGAAYLLYLAWRAFRAPAASLDDAAQSSLSGSQLYARGVLMNVTNPKVAIFFLAFLPQFADPARGPLSVQIVLLGAIFMLAALIVFNAIAIFAGFLGERLRGSGRAQRVLNRLAGIVFVGLALRLLASRQSI